MRGYEWYVSSNISTLVEIGCEKEMLLELGSSSRLGACMETAPCDQSNVLFMLLYYDNIFMYISERWGYGRI